MEETTKKVTKAKEIVFTLLTEYKNVPISCSKCGDKIRTDDNGIYCPHLIADCPLLK